MMQGIKNAIELLKKAILMDGIEGKKCSKITKKETVNGLHKWFLDGF